MSGTPAEKLKVYDVQDTLWRAGHIAKTAVTGQVNPPTLNALERLGFMATSGLNRAAITEAHIAIWSDDIKARVQAYDARLCAEATTRAGANGPATPVTIREIAQALGAKLQSTRPSGLPSGADGPQPDRKASVGPALDPGLSR